jgi:hypothetical protein
VNHQGQSVLTEVFNEAARPAWATGRRMRLTCVFYARRSRIPRGCKMPHLELLEVVVEWWVGSWRVVCS